MVTDRPPSHAIEAARRSAIVQAARLGIVLTEATAAVVAANLALLAEHHAVVHAALGEGPHAAMGPV